MDRALLVLALLGCMAVAIQAVPAVPTRSFPFCECDRSRENTTYVIQEPMTKEVINGSLCFKIQVNPGGCLNSASKCCNFDIKKIELWVNAKCAADGRPWGNGMTPWYMGKKDNSILPLKVARGGIEIRQSNVATFPITPSTTEVLKLDMARSIAYANSWDYYVCFNLTNPAAKCKTLEDLCYNNGEAEGTCFISLFDKDVKCCPTFKVPPPDRPGDALPPPPFNPPPWSRCICNNSRDATPFHLSDTYTVTSTGQGTNKYCWSSKFVDMSAPRKDRCPNARFVHKIEWSAKYSMRDALKKVEVIHADNSVRVFEGTEIGWRDAKTGDNVLRIPARPWFHPMLNIPRAEWQAGGVNVCLHIDETVPLNQFMDTRGSPVDALWAIFDETRTCCPYGWSYQAFSG